MAVTWCDPLIGQGRLFARRVTSLYPVIIRRSPTAWGTIFHATNTAPAFAAVRAVLRAQVPAVLQAQLAATDPELVLSVHPLLNHVTAAILRRRRRRAPLVTVVTDLAQVHRGWACRSAALVVVPTEMARAGVLRWGVSPSRVRVLGLPVDLRFRPPEPGERDSIRRRLGLQPERPTVLVAGGGEGSGGLLEQVRALALAPQPWQLIVVCGRNEPARRQLLATRLATPTLVLGFVDDMPDLMRASDLAVGKAGPGTIAEALTTGVPMVLTSYLPGQETGNVRYVAATGAGAYAPRPARLLATVEHLLTGDGVLYRQMAARAAELARPGAALAIAASCLETAAAYRAAGQASR